jgi:hypothetical protein
MYYNNTTNNNTIKKLNIQDIYKSIYDRKHTKHESYEILLQKIYNKILKASENNFYDCVNYIPTFLIGYPIYNFNRCIAYIIYNIRKSGFIVKFFMPNIIYTSWNPKEINIEINKNKKKNINLLENIIQSENNNNFVSKNISNNVSPKYISNVVNKPKVINNNSLISMDSDYSSSFMPLHIPEKFPAPISTNKKIEYHPDSLKYDPNKFNLPIYKEKIQNHQENDNTSIKEMIKKCNSNGKYILDLN